jgi:hypothetical protein
VKNPLVSRPGYGQKTPVATAELPTGGPADRGQSLSDDVPGHKTFVKPLDDNGTSDSPDPGSIYRKDGPRDLAKPQDGGGDTIDQSHSSPGYMGLGPKDPGDYSKTKYPYRDGKPNQKNAQFVAQIHILERKQPLLLTYKERTAALVATKARGKVAVTSDEIMAGLNPKFVERAQSIQPSMKRADPKNMRWIFSVPGSKGNIYAVKLHAMRPRKNTTKFSKMDLQISCSCPAWRWQGPEFHGEMEEYQNKKTPLQGTATTPNIRDPEWQNRVCKHVAAVLDMTRGWEVPVTQPKMKKKR